MAPSGPWTIAQVCTLEYCHPANGNKGPKQDNPKRKHCSAGKIATEEEKGTCEMLIELHPLIEVEKKSTYISPLRPGGQCEMCRKLLHW